MEVHQSETATAMASTGIDGLDDVLVLTAEVGGHEVRDVEEAVASEAEVYEGGLDGGLDVGDASLVDVSDVRGGAGALHVEFFEAGVFD